MSAQYFNLFAPDLVQTEWRSMQRARAAYMAALIEAIDAHEIGTEVRALEHEAAAAETICRAAFKHVVHEHLARLVVAARAARKKS